VPRWTRFRQLWGPDPRSDVDDELQFHLEMRTAEYLERGASPDRARELARQRFGEFDGTRATCVDISKRRRRHMKMSDWMREFLQDLTHAARTLRRTPGFAVAAIATLALGIGATTAVFSVVHAVLIEGLPYRHADRLYRVGTLYPDGTSYSLSAPDFMSVKALAQSVDGVEAYARGLYTMAGSGEPREVRGIRVSRGLFELLGFGTSLGRPFAPGEHVPDGPGVVVLDHGFWTREFGADPAVIGRRVQLAGEPRTIVGVLAPHLTLGEPCDIYVPIPYGPTFDAHATRGRRNEFLRVIGRAAPGVGAQAINADLARIGQQLQQQFPDTNGRLTFNVRPEAELLVGETRRPLLVMLGAVALVLLAACANVASLMLTRGSARRTELAVRAALGAGRGRLVRQLVAEALVLGLGGGLAGVALADVAVRLLVWAQPADVPLLEAVAVNGAVVAFAFVCSALTALLFGIVPAIQSTGGGLLRYVHAGGRGGDGGGHRLRGALVVAETALAVVLLVGAGLLVRSFSALTRVDAGFVPDHAVSFRVTFQGPAYAERPAFVGRTGLILERLRGLPGVTAVAATSELPLGGRGSMIGFAVVGAPPPPDNVNAEIAAVGVTPDYIRAIGGAVLQGRGLTADDDRADAAPVALVNEAAVRQWFPDGSAVGKRVDADTTREIVGVIADVRQEGMGQPALPQIYAPMATMPSRSVRVVVRSTSDTAAISSAIRHAVADVDRALPVAELAPLETLIATSLARPRFYTTVLTAFAASALLLAAVGLFGVLSYSVLQRRREIGVRLALGARGAQVTRMVVGAALQLVGLGVAIGLLAALAAGRVLERQLFEVRPADPVTLGLVAAVLVATGIAASYLPARRASSLDPGTVLRES